MTPLYEIVYSDGVRGASLEWGYTLWLLRFRLHGPDSLRARGIRPVRVERVA